MKVRRLRTLKSQVRRKSTRTAAAAAVLPLYAISLVYLKMNGGREVKMALPARRWDLNYKSDSIIPGLESCHHIRSSDDHMFNLHFNPYLAFVWYDHYQLPFPGCLFQLFFIHPPIRDVPSPLFGESSRVRVSKNLTRVESSLWRLKSSRAESSLRQIRVESSRVWR